MIRVKIYHLRPAKIRVAGVRWSLMLLCLLFVATPTSVGALTNAQKDLLKSGVHYYDIAGSDCSTTEASTSSSSTLTGKDNIEKAYNYFKNAGLSDVQAAAVTGNFKQESHLIPTIRQIGGNSKDPRTADPLGWGIAQWTPASKIIGIAKDLKINGPIYELGTQLDIVLAEMKGTAPTGYKDVYGGLRKINDLSSAVEYFRANFEAGTMGNRQQYAREILKDLGGNSDGTSAVTGSDAPTGCNAVGAVDCDNTANGGDTNSAALSTVRQNAVCIAEAELQKWKSGTMKPGTDFYKYSQGLDEEWCADFVSWVYNQAGYPLSNAKGGNESAVKSIQQIGQRNQKFTYHTVASGYTPAPGDLAIHIYTTGGNETGHHVNMVVSVNQNKKTMTLIGGNQDGSSRANTSSKVSKDTVNSYSYDSTVGFVSPKE